MVVICDCTKPYPKFKEDKYGDYFSADLSLSCFQKYSIEAIVEGHHSLICVPTGNGKTLPAEFAIRHFTALGKKVIYTSPIKALSNQKYYDFKQKYPHISFGLLTGDIKLNPDADVIIMTAEILQNALYMKTSTDKLSFEMDFQNELACVIHDEVHSIGMPDRGQVWETIFMLLPAHVQNVMLSATLDRPEHFAEWCENIHKNKQVYLTALSERIVPLTHYSFITCNEGIFKKLKDKTLEKEIRDLINTPIPIFNQSSFHEISYRKVIKILNIFKQKGLYIKRQFVLNQLCQYLVDHNMLPCACFILSRKQLEVAAREVTVSLLEDDSKTPYIIRRRCETILRDKLSNYQEYLELPEYQSMVALLEKGIATHHSGTIPILKEIVELLFVEGYIKMLFCTETFSCGLNMPIKTTIFTDLHKFDGNDFRLLHGYEYNQASGRAGRRGIDKEGSVIHLNNLFRGGEPINIADYSHMMSGKPQRLNSHYKISYQLLLSSFNADIVEKSLLQKEMNIDLQLQDNETEMKQQELEQIKKTVSLLKTPLYVLKEYDHLVETLKIKKKKDIERKIASFKEQYYSIEEDCKWIVRIKEIETELLKMKQYRHSTKIYLQKKMDNVTKYLKSHFFIDIDSGKPLIKGEMAKCLKEVPCLLFANLLFRNEFCIVDEIEIVMILSCFASFSVNNKKIYPVLCSEETQRILKMIETEIIQLRLTENDLSLETGENYDLQYDLMGPIEKWIKAESVEECKWVIQCLSEEGIFLGEFTKAILKIVAIINELVIAAEKVTNYEFMQKLQIISKKLQKYIATNQSLYI